MSMRFDTSELRRRAPELRAGEEILLSGTVYTARDAAHKRMAALLAENRPLPFALEGAAIYYAGSTPARVGAVCGSFGPTTSGRMDAFAPALYDRGLSATIGKGNRSAAVVEAIRRNRAVYLVAIGGAGAIAARHIASLEEIAFPELGCESVKRLVFSDFPLIVGIDCAGGNIYERGKD